MILYLTTADTELLMLSRALAALPEGFPRVRAGNPSDWNGDLAPLEALLAETRVVVLRWLGGRRAFPEAFDRIVAHARERGAVLLAWPGDQEPDPELAAATTVPEEDSERAFRYALLGGVANFRHLLRLLADAYLGTTFGYGEPEPLPWQGIYLPGQEGAVTREEWLRRHAPDGRPAVGLLFYRAHWMSGNLAFVDALAAALEEAGCRPLAAFCYSLKPPTRHEPPAVFSECLQDQDGRPLVDAVVTTLSFSLGHLDEASGRIADAWAADALERLDVPILQAVVSVSERARWAESSMGLGPLDVAMNVAMPELDGRIITVPVCFKAEALRDPVLDAPVRRYQPVPDRVRQVASIAARWARLRRKPNGEKRLAILLTNYPAKNSRIGNAVGLDTPASVVRLLRALAAAGYRVEGIPEDGDRLITALIDRCTNDREYLTDEQLEMAAGHLPAADYTRIFDRLPDAVRAGLQGAWGTPPGSVMVHGGRIVIAGIQLGAVFVGIQPPRGFGENPIAVYHSPDLLPTHHYVGYYRWLRDDFSADAVVHVGKHGTLEWLPGKGIGLSAECYPEVILQDLPNFYQYIVNNPGEGTQAKRRSHACIIDHMIPPMQRAEVYDDLARLEHLLDQYYQVQSLDPSKIPLLQSEIWDVVLAARLDHDLGAEARPHDFDAFLQEIDGYLCELKAAQIRDGLHTLGDIPETVEAFANALHWLVRLPNGEIPSLPAALAAERGLDWDALRAEPGRPLPGGPWPTRGDAWEAVEAEAQALLRAAVAETGCQRGGARRAEGASAGRGPRVRAALDYATADLAPRLRRTGEEISNLLRGLEGRFVPPGPSGAPTRGMASILPTGRNFYSVDPRALPSQAAWSVGRQLGDAVLQRYGREAGRPPETVGIVLWGTAAMRTQGDDIAEVLHLLGVRPKWQRENRRVAGIEVVPLAELGRPRIDVVVRLSGFFRDAFPNLIHLMDQAVHMVAELDEPAEANFVRKHLLEDLQRARAGGGADDEARVRALYRLFGSRPGSYGSGILPLIESRRWEGDADLARVYVTWAGYAYTQAEFGRPAPAEFRARLAQVAVATKNQDNREHDIFDSDDYFQDHGGMVATIRAITGTNPRQYFGDSADPSRPAVRDLADEARRVFRTRVVNPRWLDSIRRHGYKGAMELAATVDFLFGYDATAHVVEDWMYEQVAERYALDPDMQAFFSRSNPWAWRDVAERLLEAAARGLWEQPDPALTGRLRQALLAAEGLLEGRQEEGTRA